MPRMTASPNPRQPEMYCRSTASNTGTWDGHGLRPCTGLGRRPEPAPVWSTYAERKIYRGHVGGQD